MATMQVLRVRLPMFIMFLVVQVKVRLPYQQGACP
jgi:hypothetical protein